MTFQKWLHKEPITTLTQPSYQTMEHIRVLEKELPTIIDKYRTNPFQMRHISNTVVTYIHTIMVQSNAPKNSNRYHATIRAIASIKQQLQSSVINLQQAKYTIDQLSNYTTDNNPAKKEYTLEDIIVDVWDGEQWQHALKHDEFTKYDIAAQLDIIKGYIYLQEHRDELRQCHPDVRTLYYRTLWAIRWQYHDNIQNVQYPSSHYESIDFKEMIDAMLTPLQDTPNQPFAPSHAKTIEDYVHELAHNHTQETLEQEIMTHYLVAQMAKRKQLYVPTPMDMHSRILAIIEDYLANTTYNHKRLLNYQRTNLIDYMMHHETQEGLDVYTQQDDNETIYQTMDAYMRYLNHEMPNTQPPTEPPNAYTILNHVICAYLKHHEWMVAHLNDNEIKENPPVVYIITNYIDLLDCIVNKCDHPHKIQQVIKLTKSTLFHAHLNETALMSNKPLDTLTKQEQYQWFITHASSTMVKHEVDAQPHNKEHTTYQPYNTLYTWTEHEKGTLIETCIRENIKLTYPIHNNIFHEPIVQLMMRNQEEPHQTTLILHQQCNMPMDTPYATQYVHLVKKPSWVNVLQRTMP